MQFQPSEPHHHHLRALTNGPEKALLGLGVMGTVLAIAAIPTFIVGPFMVKAFKPEWSYGRRLATSLAFSTVVGASVSLLRAASGDKKEEAAAPAAATPAPLLLTSGTGVKVPAGLSKNALKNPWIPKDASPLTLGAVTAGAFYLGFRWAAPKATTLALTTAAGAGAYMAWRQREKIKAAVKTATATATSAIGAPVAASRATTPDAVAVEVAALRMISPQAIMPASIFERAEEIAWCTNTAPFRPSVPMV
jgi:hypothetical protein